MYIQRLDNVIRYVPPLYLRICSTLKRYMLHQHRPHRDSNDVICWETTSYESQTATFRIYYAHSESIEE